MLRPRFWQLIKWKVASSALGESLVFPRDQGGRLAAESGTERSGRCNGLECGTEPAAEEFDPGGRCGGQSAGDRRGGQSAARQPEDANAP